MLSNLRTRVADAKAVPGTDDSKAIHQSPGHNVYPVVHERRLVKIMQTLESRLPHSVQELAREVNLSPAHLQRLYKQETGADISTLLYERRLLRAADLLSTTSMGVKEVAYEVGYGHHSSFVRAFERRFGQPPSRYRLNRARNLTENRAANIETRAKFS